MPSEMEAVREEYRAMYRGLARALQARLMAGRPKNVLVAGFGASPELDIVAATLKTARIVGVETDFDAVQRARSRFAATADAGRVTLVHDSMESPAALQELNGCELMVAFFVTHLLESPSESSATWFDLMPPRARLLSADWCAPAPVELDARWALNLELDVKFRETNPIRPATVGAVLRSGVKL